MTVNGSDTLESTVAAAKSIEVGQIYWVHDFPPLDGVEPSRRPAIVIDLVDGDPIVVIGVTTERTDPDRIDLPNLRDEPGATTGLPDRCSAIPRWIINLDRNRIHMHEYAGYLPQVTLTMLSDAVDEILSEWPPRVKLPKSD